MIGFRTSPSEPYVQVSKHTALPRSKLSRAMDFVGCQKSAGRLLGVASAIEGYSKMDFHGVRSPVAVPELATAPQIDGI